MHPCGAVPFFLPKYVGQGKATELLMKGKNILDEEALRLNLINEILPENNFENLCIQKIKELTDLDMKVLRRTKRLLHSYEAELEKYFKIEDEFLYSP